MATLTTEYQLIDQAYLGNSYGNTYVRIYAKYSEQDIPNNKTKVQYQARGYYDGATYILDQRAAGNLQGTGVSEIQYRRTSQFASGETILGTGEGWVTHEEDGTKEIQCSAYLNFPTWRWSNTASGVATLPSLHKAPKINSISLTETNQQLTSISVPNGTIVNWLSIKRISANYELDVGATISNIKAYNGLGIEIGSQSSSPVTADFTQSATNSGMIMVSITDNTTSTGTYQQLCPYIPYNKPALEYTSTNIKRKTSSSSIGLIDNKVELKLNGTMYKSSDVVGTANTITCQYKVWKDGVSEPQYTSTLSRNLDSGGTLNYETNSATISVSSTGALTISGLEIGLVNYLDVYHYKIKIYDRFNNIDETSGDIPTGDPVWTEYKNRVDFKDITIKKSHIIESGSNSNGNWIKYHDGTMICWYTIENVNVNVNSAWGSIYSKEYTLHNYPQTFISIPTVNITLLPSQSSKWAGWLGISGSATITLPSVTSPGTVNLLRATSGNCYYSFSVIAIGKWK